MGEIGQHILAWAGAIITLSGAFGVLYKLIIQPRIEKKAKEAEVEKQKAEYKAEAERIAREQELREERGKTEAALADFGKLVRRSYALSAMNARTTIAMAEELSTDGRINGKTTESVEKLRDEVYKGLLED